jgi:Na+/H+ antiporter NhaC
MAQRIAQAVLVGLAAVVLFVLVIPALTGRPVYGLADIIPARCVVGLAGAAVSIDVSGVGAIAVCDAQKRITTDGGNWYQYAGGTEPAGAVICQVEIQGISYTVRDMGALNLYGSSLCSELFARQ